ncbi:MAG TPA: XRE family transcriptional regulator [Candidatus Binataceae bacterium]|nr:XRE family transcriptional regulator [Candidatus Binataceae bacterium]
MAANLRPAPPPVQLHARLGALRRARGWSLAELASRTQLSRPYLSRLESGNRQPSLAALLALSQAYQMPLQSLVDSGVEFQPSAVTVSGERTQIRRGNGLLYRTVSGGGPGVNLNAVHVTVPNSRRPVPLAHHEGEELLYVLSGALNLSFEHQTHLLKPGDSAHFDARRPHRLAAADNRDAEVLLVAYVPAARREESVTIKSAPAIVSRPRAVGTAKTLARKNLARSKKVAAPLGAVAICTALEQTP